MKAEVVQKVSELFNDKLASGSKTLLFQKWQLLALEIKESNL